MAVKRVLASLINRLSSSAHSHLANEAVLVHPLALLALCVPGKFGPHLLDILEHHVAMSVKGLDTG